MQHGCWKLLWRQRSSTANLHRSASGLVDSSKYIPWNPFSVFSRAFAIRIWISTCIQAILCSLSRTHKILKTPETTSAYIAFYGITAQIMTAKSQYISICLTISLQTIANVAQHEHILRSNINFTQALLQWRIWVLWYMVKKETLQISSCTPCIP